MRLWHVKVQTSPNTFKWVEVESETYSGAWIAAQKATGSAIVCDVQEVA
jgi:hypothetical protein